ncbi:septum formation family protein [Catenuloplanes japonicus]|uniref:septum formation family protein n=1 Tax=Catenuloplanes japonicus TaxID=33876 RepID=UPI000525F02F|nr:septum formation family protein [Catenuloplanes japonicus]
MSTEQVGPGPVARFAIVVGIAVALVAVLTGGWFVGNRVLGTGGDAWEAMERLGGEGCFDLPDATEGAFVPAGIRQVDCARPHNAEMMKRQGKPDEEMSDDYADVAKLEDGAPLACEAAMIRELLDTMTVPVGARVRWFIPTAQQWAAGHRGVYCYYAFEGDLPTETVRALPPGQLSNDQHRFPGSAAFVHLQARIAFADGTFSTRRNAALAVVRHLGERDAVYRTGFETLRPQMDALIAEDTILREKWQAAVDAADEPAFLAALAAVGAPGPSPTELAVREAIGLPTVQGGKIKG